MSQISATVPDSTQTISSRGRNAKMPPLLTLTVVDGPGFRFAAQTSGATPRPAKTIPITAKANSAQMAAIIVGHP